MTRNLKFIADDMNFILTWAYMVDGFSPVGGFISRGGGRRGHDSALEVVAILFDGTESAVAGLATKHCNPYHLHHHHHHHYHHNYHHYRCFCCCCRSCRRRYRRRYKIIITLIMIIIIIIVIIITIITIIIIIIIIIIIREGEEGWRR